MMEIVTTAIASATIGAIVGMVIKHIQDGKYIQEISGFATEQMKKIMREDLEVISQYMQEVERLTQVNNDLQIKLAQRDRASAWEVTDLGFQDSPDLDFPNSQE